MGDRGILFSAPMVRALIEGRKTQTRRLAGGKRRLVYNDYFEADMPSGPVKPTIWQKVEPGDKLWCRETHCIVDWPSWDAPYCVYRAADPSPQEAPVRWRPSIHMPRWASRLTLIVTDRRLERLQDITEEDAKAEGVETDPETLPVGGGVMSRRRDFRLIWDSIHGAGAWDKNPEVVAITFTVHKTNIDAMGKEIVAHG